MKRLALYLGTPLVLGVVLAGVAALNPAPVDAVDLPTIVDLPAVDAKACKDMSASQATAFESTGAAAAMLAVPDDDEDCITMVKAAKLLCKKHGPTSAKCETAKDDAIEICMEVVD